MTAPTLHEGHRAEWCLWCRTRKEPPSLAIAAFTGACLHEHIGEAPVCAAHLAEAQRLSARLLFCHLCRRAGEDSHYCPIVITGVREWPVSTAATRGEGS